jgi:hypothetical protein
MVKIHYDPEELAWTVHRTGRGRQGDKHQLDEIRKVFLLDVEFSPERAKYMLISELPFRQSLFYAWLEEGGEMGGYKRKRLRETLQYNFGKR